jgi:type VI secretion system secreted protein Hcp
MAVAIYIKFPAGIKGETEQAGHEEEVAATSLQWGAGRAISIASVGRETGLATVSDIVFTKSFDSASNDLANACLLATPLDEIVITFRKDAGEASLDYLAYTLTDCLISNYSMSAGGETPVESVSISFIKIKGLYKKQASDHSAASEHEFEYSLRARV